MKGEGLKNIVLLKDLPSNIIEEAIIVLKENKKIHKYQNIIDKNNNRKKEDCKKEGFCKDDYIVKEAYMLLDDYTKTLEKESSNKNKNLKKIEKRYKISILVNTILLVLITLGVIIVI